MQTTRAFTGIKATTTRVSSFFLIVHIQPVIASLCAEPVLASVDHASRLACTALLVADLLISFQ